MDETGSSEPQSRSWPPTLRRLLSMILILTAATVSFLTYVVGNLKFCQDELASVGTRPVVRVCGPIGLTAILPILLVALALLWPDLSEIAIPGFLSLRRAVQQQGERIEGAVSRLEQRVSQQVTFNAILAPDWRQVQEKIEQKAPQLGADRRAIFESLQDSRRPRPELATLEQDLLATWEQLEPYLQPGVDPMLRDSFTEQQTALIDDWRILFNEEIRYVQAARNAVLHSPYDVSHEDLSEALDSGHRLRALLEAKLSETA